MLMVVTASMIAFSSAFVAPTRINVAPKNPVVLFDGDCSLCDSWVNFLVENDPHATLRFAPLRSPTGRRLLEQNGLPTDVEEIVLAYDGGCLRKSDAVLEISRIIEWREDLRPAASAVAALGRAVPPFLRDAVMDVVSTNRHRFQFGDDELCRPPSPDDALRFIDEEDEPLQAGRKLASHLDPWTPFSISTDLQMRRLPDIVITDCGAVSTGSSTLDAWAPACQVPLDETWEM